MPAYYPSIQADIVDIGVDTPSSEDVFLVDTNVWYWAVYSTAPSILDWQLSYVDYILEAFQVKATLCCANLAFAELASSIEKAELRSDYPDEDNRPDLKEYRHNNNSARNRVVGTIQDAWDYIFENFSLQQLDVSIDAQAVSKAYSRLNSSKMDGYDLFILETMNQHGINKIITGDGDYSNVSGIEVFTSNPSVIRAAEQRERLVVR